ncbi:hypothetical protein CVN56_11685 [Rhodococcus sp. AQ5-07]|nr:hypothetical protein CVN56_11685 [Rhodococcus sp. AQ5-07]
MEVHAVEASRRYLALMGGRDRVVREAKTVAGQGDHQRSAELLRHVSGSILTTSRRESSKPRNFARSDIAPPIATGATGISPPPASWTAPSTTPSPLTSTPPIRSEPSPPPRY